MTQFPTEGFLYIITGKQSYFDEVLISVRSLKQHNPEAHITLITDRENTNADIVALTALVNNWVHDPPHDYDNWADALVYKVKNLLNTPYEKTIFLDTDTYIAGQVDVPFRLLDSFDMCLTEAPTDVIILEDDAGEKYHGYHAYNTGVIAYNKNERIHTLFRRWYEIYAADPVGIDNDQPALMTALLDCPTVICQLRNNWNAHVPYYFGVNGAVVIFHGRPKDWERIVGEINRNLRPRVWLPQLDMVFLRMDTTRNFLRLIRRLLVYLVQRRDESHPVHTRYR